MFPNDTKIMIVDDMLTMRKIIEKCLRELGYSKFSGANDGETAWPEIESAALKAAPYQLVISDWNMPKMKGIDLLRKVRNHPQIKNTPFVLVTAEAEKSQIQEALAAGVSAYVIKPFSSSSLAEKLKIAYASSVKKVAA